MLTNNTPSKSCNRKFSISSWYGTYAFIYMKPPAAFPNSPVALHTALHCTVNFVQAQQIFNSFWPNWKEHKWTMNCIHSEGALSFISQLREKQTRLPGPVQGPAKICSAGSGNFTLLLCVCTSSSILRPRVHVLSVKTSSLLHFNSHGRAHLVLRNWTTFG